MRINRAGRWLLIMTLFLDPAHARSTPPSPAQRERVARKMQIMLNQGRNILRNPAFTWEGSLAYENRTCAHIAHLTDFFCCSHGFTCC